MSLKSKQRNKNQASNSTAVSFTLVGWEDYCYWQDQNSEIVTRVKRLITECLRDPFKGIGKPEPLKGDLSGYWSRRITHEHRLVYSYEEGKLTILQCRFHYDD